MSHPHPRHLQTVPIGGPPPTAGAVDLQQLKPMSDADAVKFFNEQLVAYNIMCDCGELIKDDAYLIFVRSENILPTPVGRGPGLAQTLVHSLDCAKMMAIQMQEDVTIIARRKVNPVEWFLPADADIASS